MLQISQNILEEIHSQNISELTVRIISGGCAGNKIEVLYSRPENTQNFQNLGNLDCNIWVPKEQAEKLDGGLIAKTSKSWILTHPNIQSRCGCATSFSFEKKGKIASLHVLKDLKKKFTKPTS